MLVYSIDLSADCWLLEFNLAVSRLLACSILAESRPLCFELATRLR
jgi:hypothetical protein